MVWYIVLEESKEYMEINYTKINRRLKIIPSIEYLLIEILNILFYFRPN